MYICINNLYFTRIERHSGVLLRNIAILVGQLINYPFPYEILFHFGSIILRFLIFYTLEVILSAEIQHTAFVSGGEFCL